MEKACARWRLTAGPVLADRPSGTWDATRDGVPVIVKYFDDATFRFLRALARHNDRDWFQAHKPDYETHLRQPFLRLVADLEDAAQVEPLPDIDFNIRAGAGADSVTFNLDL